MLLYCLLTISLQSSTNGIMLMLASDTIIHCVAFNETIPNAVCKNGTKATSNISPNKPIKLKLKLKLLKILIVNILSNVLQFIAWIICIKQIIKNTIVVATLFPYLFTAITNTINTKRVWTTD